MNIQTNVVAQVVGEQGVHCLGKSVVIFSSQGNKRLPYISGNIKPELVELIPQPSLCDSMQLIQGQIGVLAAEG